MANSAAPAGYHSVTPYLIVSDVSGLIQFLQDVFDAKTKVEPMVRPDGSIMHTELRLGDSVLMMGEPVGIHNAMPASMYVYVTNCDATYAAALKAGAQSTMEPSDQPHGDRYGGVIDPYGNRWYIAQHLRDVPESEFRAKYEKGD